jgi:hypothetical protein
MHVCNGAVASDSNGSGRQSRQLSGEPAMVYRRGEHIAPSLWTPRTLPQERSLCMSCVPQNPRAASALLLAEID